jgi:hypothetical protein
MKMPCLALSLFCAGLAFSFCNVLGAEPKPSLQTQKLGFSFSNEITLSSDAELKGTDTDYKYVAVQNYSWTLAQAIPLDGNRSATVSLGYNLVHTAVEEPDRFNDDDTWDEFKASHPNWNRVPVPSRLQSLTASIDYSQEINDRWSASTSLSAGSYVTKTGLLSQGWGISASAMGLYKWDSSLTLAIGAAYDSLSSDFRFIPIIGLDYQLSEKWSMALGFPSTAVTYQMRKSLAMSIGLSGAGGVYYVKEDPQPGAAARSLAGSKLETMEVRLGFKTEWQINDTFSISGTLGNVLYREFKYIDRDYKLKSHNMVSFISIGGSCAF